VHGPAVPAYVCPECARAVGLPIWVPEV
jgi:hypothetical protein